MHNGTNYTDLTYKSGTTIECDKKIKATDLVTTNIASVEADI